MWPAGHMYVPFTKESFQVRWANSILIFLHAAIYLEVSLFRWTSQNAFPHVQMILCAMLLCTIAHSIVCTRLFRGKMHYDWFIGIEILQGRWQHGEKVEYCYPSGLEKTLCEWDIYVLLVTKGLKSELLTNMFVSYLKRAYYVKLKQMLFGDIYVILYKILLSWHFSLHFSPLFFFYSSSCRRSFFTTIYHIVGARGSAVGWGTALQVGRSRVRFPMVSLEFFHWHNPSGRTMALGLTQPLTEMSTRNIS